MRQLRHLEWPIYRSRISHRTRHEHRLLQSANGDSNSLSGILVSCFEYCASAEALKCVVRNNKFLTVTEISSEPSKALRLKAGSKSCIKRNKPVLR